MSTPTASRKNKASAAPKKPHTATYIHRHPLRTMAITIVASIVVMLVLVRLYPTVTAATGNAGAVKRAVARHFVLPTDERPAVISVSNPDTDVPFFADAKDGDKLLVYQQNQLAILYRPSSDRIITVGPISGL